MSASLWKYYYDEELENFRQLLYGRYSKKPSSSKAPNERVSSYGSLEGSSTSPKNVKQRKYSSQYGHPTRVRGSNITIGYADINCRDHSGLTLLHRAASSTSKIKVGFAMILLEHPALDLYIQDVENGWTALHRALYFGNISLARAIIRKDLETSSGKVGGKSPRVFSSLFKIKDHEGNSPFDLYNATISKKPPQKLGSEYEGSEFDEVVNEPIASNGSTSLVDCSSSIVGDEVFAWGSNRNHGLGFKDQDDRHHPERIILKRPDELTQKLYEDFLKSKDNGECLKDKTAPPKSISDLPTLITHQPILIQDVILSKLHSAILTTDPESNLYMCGFGPGGRLGTGDEDTRFSYVPVSHGLLVGKRVSKIALGQNHTLAVIANGSLLSWGSNLYGQLGYTLPRPTLIDEEPIYCYPRQIFGPLKREIIIGVAASALHSVAHTLTSLFTWGKNQGQLGLMDSDSRSLEIQPLPRKVATSLFKGPICSVSAIDNATIVLLSNHNVFVFSNYGYNIVKFPLFDEPSNYSLKMNYFATGYNPRSNYITSIAAGGDSIAAVSSGGDLFLLHVRSIPSSSATSTTNPAKIRESLSSPERIWTARKSSSLDGVQSVGIIENGSVILCTRAGAVWRHSKRGAAKDLNKNIGASKFKKLEFQRIPGLINIAAIRSTIFGVYVAIQRNCDFLQKRVPVNEKTLWNDIAPLTVLSHLQISEPTEFRVDQALTKAKVVAPEPLVVYLRRTVPASDNLETCVGEHVRSCILDKTLNINIKTTNSDVKIPAHSFILGRSPVLREALKIFRETGEPITSDILTIENESSHNIFEDRSIKVTLIFKSLDFITMFNLLLYLYTDDVVDVWQFTRYYPVMKFRYRQVRAELMKVANNLKLEKLETAARSMIEPEKIMHIELDKAIQDSAFFGDADVIIQVKGFEMRAHSAILCRRCPFFEGLFNGRAAGKWLSSRRQENKEVVRVDLKHIEADVFNVVLRYIYTDLETELFEDIVRTDIDEFSDLVLDVMTTANELILNRLSQICQEIIGRFVNARNVCNLLNFIAPFSVTSFKEFALKFICINLESMFENQFLNDLEDDVLSELDRLVRETQLEYLPFSKSDRADHVLHQNNPHLAEEINEERRRRILEMSFISRLKDHDIRTAYSPRARIGSSEDTTLSYERQKMCEEFPNIARTNQFSSNIRKRQSVVDMMFNIDDDNDAFWNRSSKASALASENEICLESRYSVPESSQSILDTVDLATSKINSSISHSQTEKHEKVTDKKTCAAKTWSPIVFPTSKLGMREIMEQTSSSRHSILSMDISTQKAKDSSEIRATPPKLSQKERKKQRQHVLDKSPGSLEDLKTSSPWKIALNGEKISLQKTLNTSSLQAVKPPRFLKMTLPATHSNVVEQKKSQFYPSSSNAKTCFSQNNHILTAVPSSRPGTTPSNKPEPSLMLPMADIIVQQKRELEIIKDAVSRRSLREIQEEQEFQEWWDQESKRVLRQEAAKTAMTSGSSEKNAESKTSHGKSRKRRGKSSRSRGASS